MISNLMNILLIIVICLLVINILIASIRYYLNRKIYKGLRKIADESNAGLNFWRENYQKESEQLLKGYELVRKEYAEYLTNKDKEIADLEKVIKENSPKTEKDLNENKSKEINNNQKSSK